jgi:hypothetical protein
MRPHGSRAIPGSDQSQALVLFSRVCCASQVFNSLGIALCREFRLVQHFHRSAVPDLLPNFLRVSISKRRLSSNLAAFRCGSNGMFAFWARCVVGQSTLHQLPPEGADGRCRSRQNSVCHRNSSRKVLMIVLTTPAPCRMLIMARSV